MATPRVLKVSFQKIDDDDEFSFGASYLANNTKLQLAIDEKFDVFIREMAGIGYVDHSPMTHLKRRITAMYRRSVDRLCFNDRFEPIAAWLEGNGVRRAGTTGKFYGTHSYRIKNMDVHRGFTISFGAVNDAVLFKLRWM